MMTGLASTGFMWGRGGGGGAGCLCGHVMGMAELGVTGSSLVEVILLSVVRHLIIEAVEHFVV